MLGFLTSQSICQILIFFRDLLFLCQPSLIRFMNFLFNISETHTCAVSVQIVSSSLLLLSLSLGDIRNSRYFWHDLGPGFLCCVEGQRPTGLPLSIFSVWTRVVLISQWYVLIVRIITVLQLNSGKHFQYSQTLNIINVRCSTEQEMASKTAKGTN